MSNRADIEIRKARAADLHGIAEVLVATWRSTFADMLPGAFLDAMTVEEQMQRHRRRMLAPEASYFVAAHRQDGRIVGIAGSGPSRVPRMPYGAELYSLYVLDAFQGFGIGKGLVRAAAFEAVQRDHRSMLVWVLADNPNRRFYSRLGAVPVGRAPVSIGGVTLGQVGYAWDDLVEQFGLEMA